MSNVFIGILLAVGVGGWVYAKTQKSTGGNTQNSLIVAGIAAFFAFVVALTILSFIPTP
jgi:hypothetical protein